MKLEKTSVGSHDCQRNLGTYKGSRLARNLEAGSAEDM